VVLQLTQYAWICITCSLKTFSPPASSRARIRTKARLFDPFCERAEEQQIDEGIAQVENNCSKRD